AIIDIKPHELRTILFTPGENETILSTKKNSQFSFTDKSKQEYVWIGELKREHAQRIANQFAAEIARVGLDESEWLRRHSTK
ncbi:MAG: hypothetical protein MUO76_08865, partial [Anaerolineaceae bacterium]|nr:hypothetical protein [Anaerolineaceae bacterium]